MQKIVSISCPKCNNNHSFYFYGRDKFGYQKFFCRKCKHQFAPDNPSVINRNNRKYPSCPMCSKSSFLHHDHEQQRIPNFLSLLDEKIEIEKKILETLQEMKKGFLQKMFV